MSAARSDEPVPTVSVLLPVYNAEPYLRAAVESVLSQTFVDYELLAFDDGSTDGSLAILREYEAKDSRVRIFSRDNRGLVPTLNELIVLARGRYLARMDADDISRPQRFEKQVMFLDSNPDYVLIGGWVERMSAAGQPIGVYRSPCSHEKIDADHLRGHLSICHASTMFRPAAVIKAGCYRDEFRDAEDLDLWLRLAEIGRIANLPEVVYQYRMLSSSLSEAEGPMQRNALRRACESAWRRRGIECRFEAVEHWRPGNDKNSHHKFALEYGWISWSHGHKRTWWTYAREAVRLRPLALSSWQLLVFGFLKTPHRQPDLEITGPGDLSAVSIRCPCGIKGKACVSGCAIVG